MKLLKIPKMTADQAEYLVESMSGETWQAIEIWLDFYVNTIKEDVLNYRIENDADERNVVRKRLQAQGAERLARMLKDSRNVVKDTDRAKRREKKQATR